MRNKLLSVVMLFFCAAMQAQDLKTYYVEMPDSLSPLLTKVNREDFCDFLASNMKAEVKNRLGRSSEMTQLTPDYLKVRLSSVSSYEMKLLPLNDSTQVICMVSTYLGPAADSHVRFYTTEWAELPTEEFIKMPDAADFLQKNKDEMSDDEKRLLQKADMTLVKAELSAEKASVSFTYATPDYLDKETADKLKGMLRKDSIVRHWRNGKFE